MNALLRFSLQHRFLIVALAVVALVGGTQVMLQLPIDIFPNLTRPRVTVMTECPGLSPEEVETLITFPLETAFNGATGVEAVRSSSGIGLSVIYVEFGWNTNIYLARQTVNERLATVASRMPEGVKPELAPISSIMGQIMMVGLYSTDGRTSPMEVRTTADWVVRPRLLTIPGVAQVISMGGGRKQFQVLVNPEQLIASGVTLSEVETALRESNENAAGGYVEQGAMEYLIRGIGRIQSIADLEQSVIKPVEGRSILLRDVARVQEGPQLKRGDCSVDGFPAVVLTVAKQPQGDTRQLTAQVLAAIEELKPSLPADLVVQTEIYQQREFIERGVENVLEALRDGAILVLIILFLFLLNVRTTFITLTAIPLSIVITGLFFYWTGMSINVMTLGGLAVAMGELVDDAIVDIENVFRRLGQNSALAQPRPALTVIYEASLEVRGAIVYGTMLVILVFLPLFALSGVEGRLFAPLGVAYIVSILASLLVSLTVTPVLGSLLLSGKASQSHGAKDSPLLRLLKWLVTPIVRTSLHRWGLSAILSLVGVAMLASVVLVLRLGTDFLPAFDEGAAQVNVVLPPGASLQQSNRVSTLVDTAFRRHMVDADHPHGLIRNWVRRSGRAELDEHAEGVNMTEYVVTLNPDSGVSRVDTLAVIRQELAEIPGIEYEAEQPLAHLISHMLSGVSAQIAIKLYGDDLDVLRQKAQEIRAVIADVPGLAPPVVEPQQLIPQLRIDLNREQLAAYGLTAGEVNDFIETALNGRVVSTVLEGQRTFDLLLRLEDQYRTDFAQIERLAIDLPQGGRVPLATVAQVYEAGGPNTINRENVRRRITIRGNTTDRDLGSVVAEIQRRITDRVSLPEGYFVQYGGQFEAQQAATRTMTLLSVVSLGGVFLVLYTLFPSTRIVLQVMFALPAAFIGGVFALWWTGQTLTVASMVGFISLGGIAARNGILLVSHYMHLMREEGEDFTAAMVLRGSLERLAPVLMTALTAGIGLVPLVIGGHQPGKEILYPVATVILGGLVTCTICEYIVHPGLFFHFSGQDATRLTQKTEIDE
jgi:CzcA family heavy metal efflux pump